MLYYSNAKFWIRKIGIIIGILALAGIGYFVYQSKTPSTETPATTLPAPTPNATSTVSTTTFTMAEVATHNGRASCYTTIRGSVYDVTAWIDKHSGGPDKILGICGTDATSAFTAQHDGQRRPEQELASFKIGTLAQ